MARDDEGLFGGISLAELAALVSIVLLFQRLSTPSSSSPRTTPVRIGPNGARRMTLGDVRALAVRVGFPDPDTAAAVAMAESAGDPDCRGDSPTAKRPGCFPDGQSFGLWQINLPAHPEYMGQNLLDPEGNARVALALSSGGRDWSAWTAYRNGTFRRFMPNA